LELPSDLSTFYLKARIERLRRDEQDLRERIAKRVSAVECEGGWLKSDPLYQSMSSVLASLRWDLGNTEKELWSRATLLGRGKELHSA
jgi:hypothetical protein